MHKQAGGHALEGVNFTLSAGNIYFSLTNHITLNIYRCHLINKTKEAAGRRPQIPHLDMYLAASKAKHISVKLVALKLQKTVER